MSTNSTIIAKMRSGAFGRIFVHYDGYLDGVGLKLFKHWTDQSKIDALIDLGNLSSLGEVVGAKHDFDRVTTAYERAPKTDAGYAEYRRLAAEFDRECTAYGRDRGESDADPEIFESVPAAWPDDTEYVYLWDGQRWLCGCPEDGSQSALDLGALLRGEAMLRPRDRQCMPWVRETEEYEAFCCFDEAAYVIRRSDGAARRFDSHLAFALWLEAHRTAKFRKGGNVRLGHMALAYGAEEPNIWNATGSFDRARHDRLRAARNKAFASLFTGPRDDAQQPPTVARPNYLAGESDTSLPGDRRRSYSFTELLTASRDAEKEIAA